MCIDQFIAKLQRRQSTDTVTNPYNCYVENIDVCPNASANRRDQLRTYLRQRQRTANIILVAEAPGYQGARFSGLAMTSERMLCGESPVVTEADILGRIGVSHRTSHIDASRNDVERRNGFTEPTATIVWREIMRAGLSQQIALWNTFPYHPHGEATPLVNRRPTRDEIDAEHQILTDLLELFEQDIRLVAIGNIARDHLRAQEIFVQHVRHPANGGAQAFRDGIRDILGAD